MKLLALCFAISLNFSTSFEVSKPSSRRAWLENLVGSAALVGTTTASFGLFPESAIASGGATAGKYTTIPIAKRRYYGRVQEGVHEFVSVFIMIDPSQLDPPIL